MSQKTPDEEFLDLVKDLCDRRLLDRYEKKVFLNYGKYKDAQRVELLKEHKKKFHKKKGAAQETTRSLRMENEKIRVENAKLSQQLKQLHEKQGGYWDEIQYLSKQVKRLEKQLDKQHNHERTIDHLQRELNIARTELDGQAETREIIRNDYLDELAHLTVRTQDVEKLYSDLKQNTRVEKAQLMSHIQKIEDVQNKRVKSHEEYKDWAREKIAKLQKELEEARKPQQKPPAWYVRAVRYADGWMKKKLKFVEPIFGEPCDISQDTEK